jgi:hypothetical protein
VQAGAKAREVYAISCLATLKGRCPKKYTAASQAILAGSECCRGGWKPPRKEKNMKMAKVFYLLDEGGRKRSLLAGGDGKELQTLECECTPELLELARVNSDGEVVLDLAGELALDLEIKPGKPGEITPFGVYSPEPPKIKEVHQKWSGKYHFSAPQTPGELIAWEKARREKVAARLAELQPEYDRLRAEYEADMALYLAEKERRAAEEAARRKETEEKAAAEKKAAAEEKAAWVQAHGSDFLKRVHALGYDCQRQYVTERAEKELPDFHVDFDIDFSWKSRSCPSEEALEMVEELISKGYNAEVVWLTEAPGLDEPCEAVVVHNYLGKYDLIRLV